MSSTRECPNCGAVALFCEPFQFSYSCICCGYRVLGERRFWKSQIYDASGDFVTDANKIIERLKKAQHEV